MTESSNLSEGFGAGQVSFHPTPFAPDVVIRHLSSKRWWASDNTCRKYGTKTPAPFATPEPWRVTLGRFPLPKISGLGLMCFVVEGLGSRGSKEYGVKVAFQVFGLAHRAWMWAGKLI